MRHIQVNSRIGQAGIFRQFVRFTKIVAAKPLEHLCMVINYVHINGAQKNALLLTVIEEYTRKLLIRILKFSIQKGDVIVILSLLLLEYKIKGMTFRNDNGSCKRIQSQFMATVVSEYLKKRRKPRVHSCSHSGGKRLHRSLAQHHPARRH
jgi:putative transposase